MYQSGYHGIAPLDTRELLYAYYILARSSLRSLILTRRFAPRVGSSQCDSLKAFQTRKQDFNKFCLDVFKFFKVDKVGKTDGEDPSSSTTGRVSPTPIKKKDSKDASKTKVEPRPVKEFSVLQQLAVEAAKYPKDLEPVRKVKREMDASRRWLDEAERVVNSDGAVLCRISMEQVNEIISSGEKLLCTMKLVKVLRSHKAAARKWASKVRDRRHPRQLLYYIYSRGGSRSLRFLGTR